MPASPAAVRDPESPEVRELLESLDDAMFAAIAGRHGTIDAVRDLWLNAVETLGRELVEESRGQYVRYAEEIARQAEYDATRDPGEIALAIEVIRLLENLRV